MKEYTLELCRHSNVKTSLFPVHNIHKRCLSEAAVDLVTVCNSFIIKHSPGNEFQYLEIISYIIKFTICEQKPYVSRKP